ncbi:MAG: BamA/TamA family outer membrane protein [Ferruginibacter sp.]
MGNETKKINDDPDFNRMRSSNYLGSIGVERVFGKHHKVSINGFYEGIDIRDDTTRYVAKTSYSNLPHFYKNNGFAGVNVDYLYQVLNDSILPTKGISFLTGAEFTNNLRNSKNSFARFTTEANIYVPLTKKFVLALKAAGSTLVGNPLFYQYNNIGGSETLRGYRRERYYGNSTAYAQNELQWISPVHSYLYNGKIGFFALYDIGRVWLDGESSDKWHSGYGGGIILCPYNLITASVSYAVSADGNNVHIQLIKAF